MELPFDQMFFIMIVFVWLFRSTVNIFAKLSQLMKDAECNHLMTWNYGMTLINTDDLNICGFPTGVTARSPSVVVYMIIYIKWGKPGFHKVCCVDALTFLNMLTSFLKKYHAHHLRSIKRLGKTSLKTLHLPHAGHSLVIYPFSMGQRADEMVIEGTSAVDLMRFEWSRYLSFQAFPQDSVMTPLRLSQAGFYYTGHGEEVKCFCCGLTNGDWTTDETAIEVHRRLSPNCEFISREETNNVSIHSQEYYTDIFETVRNNENVESEPNLYIRNNESLLGNRPASNRNNSGGPPETVRQCNSCHSTSEEQMPAKYPNYENVSDRIDSFRGRTGLHVHSPRDLAQAGFYYAGVKDYVRCFYCGMRLRSLQKGDNPLREHSRLSPNCQFVKKVLQVQDPLPQPTLPINDPVDNAALTRSNSELRRELKSMRKKIEIQQDLNRCKICLVNEINTVFLPCGHLVTCQTCAVKVRKCPICRCMIRSTVRTYQS